MSKLIETIIDKKEDKKNELYLIRRTWASKSGAHRDTIIGRVAKNVLRKNFTKIKEKANGRLVLYYLADREAALKIAEIDCRALEKEFKIKFPYAETYLDEFEPLDAEDIYYILKREEKETLYL